MEKTKQELVEQQLTFINQNEMIMKLEDQKGKLLLSLQQCQATLEQQKNDQADIYYYLNKKLDDNYDTIKSLEEQLINEQLEREIAEKQYERQIEELKAKNTQDELSFTIKVGELETKLINLKEFADQKNELTANFEKLLITLETERRQFKQLSDQMEMRAIKAKADLKRELAENLHQEQQLLHTSLEQHLTKKTQETIQVNRRVNEELQYQSKQSEKVLEFNSSMIAKERETRHELSLCRTENEELRKKLNLYRTLIKQLNERVAHDDERLSSSEQEVTALKSRVVELETAADKLPANGVMDELLSYLAEKYFKFVREGAASSNSNSRVKRANSQPSGGSSGSSHTNVQPQAVDAHMLQVIDAARAMFPHRFKNRYGDITTLPAINKGVNRTRPGQLMSDSVYSSNTNTSRLSPGSVSVYDRLLYPPIDKQMPLHLASGDNDSQSRWLYEDDDLTSALLDANANGDNDGFDAGEGLAAEDSAVLTDRVSWLSAGGGASDSAETAVEHFRGAKALLPMARVPPTSEAHSFHKIKTGGSSSSSKTKSKGSLGKKSSSSSSNANKTSKKGSAYGKAMQREREAAMQRQKQQQQQLSITNGVAVTGVTGVTGSVDDNYSLHSENSRNTFTSSTINDSLPSATPSGVRTSAPPFRRAGLTGRAGRPTHFGSSHASRTSSNNSNNNSQSSLLSTGGGDALNIKNGINASRESLTVRITGKIKMDPSGQDRVESALEDLDASGGSAQQE